MLCGQIDLNICIAIVLTAIYCRCLIINRNTFSAFAVLYHFFQLLLLLAVIHPPAVITAFDRDRFAIARLKFSASKDRVIFLTQHDNKIIYLLLRYTDLICLFIDQQPPGKYTAINDFLLLSEMIHNTQIRILLHLCKTLCQLCIIRIDGWFLVAARFL